MSNDSRMTDAAFAELDKLMRDSGGETRVLNLAKWEARNIILGTVCAGDVFRLESIKRDSPDTYGVGINVVQPDGEEVSVGLFTGGMRRFAPLFFDNYSHDTAYGEAPRPTFRSERIGQGVIIVNKGLMRGEKGQQDFYTFGVWVFPDSGRAFAAALGALKGAAFIAEDKDAIRLIDSASTPF